MAKNNNCPCSSTYCSRYGNCDACQKYHHSYGQRTTCGK